MSENWPTNCPHCQAPLPPAALVCPTCHRLVYEARVAALLEEAKRVESINPVLGAGLLKQAVALIPPGSQPHQVLASRATQLAAMSFGGAGPATSERSMLTPASAKTETFGSAILKTGGTMALSIWLYQREGGWTFAIGFTLLILIHELGHVLANWFYGLKQSPPFFIPYMGAVIFLRSNPPDAKAEAVVGIAGPVAGTIGALACYALAISGHYGHQAELLGLAQFAFLMNLFNMIPCPPLDGGRVTAAISPFLWIPGVAAFIYVMFYIGGKQIDWIVILMALWILQSALPRVRNALLRGARNNPYYKLTVPQRTMVTASYLLLAALLAIMFWGPHKLGLSFF